MAGKGQTGAYTPSMSDAAVKAKTGKNWAQWFAALDKAKAADLGHREIVAVAGKLGAGRWWGQMVTVEYERARGLRTRHETATGFSVSISKTVGRELSGLYAAAADETSRKSWFPKGAFGPSSQTKDKYLRGSWNGDARLEINFYAKGTGKAQINVQVNKLKEEAKVEAERAAWKAALERLVAKVAR
jgi:hypothetical protein